MERTEEPTLKKCVRSGWWVWTNASRRYAGCAHRSASERKTDWGSVVVSEDVELQNRGTRLTYLYRTDTAATRLRELENSDPCRCSLVTCLCFEEYHSEDERFTVFRVWRQLDPGAGCLRAVKVARGERARRHTTARRRVKLIRDGSWKLRDRRPALDVLARLLRFKCHRPARAESSCLSPCCPSGRGKALEDVAA